MVKVPCLLSKKKCALATTFHLVWVGTSNNSCILAYVMTLIGHSFRFLLISFLPVLTLVLPKVLFSLFLFF